MMVWIDIINFAAVGLFGIFLSAAFCDISWTKRNKTIFGIGVAAIAALQALNFTDFGATGLRAWYPVITHLPLVLLLAYLSGKPMWSVIAVTTAYLCCQLRRWAALLCITLLDGGAMMQAIVEIIVTLPILLFLNRFSGQAVRNMSHHSYGIQIQFGLVPVLGYVFDYMTRIYTDWLIIGLPAATEFMLFVCAVTMPLFTVSIEKGLQKQNEMAQQQIFLDLQVKQAAQQIANLQLVQEQAAAYRHDLRHHLQYLSVCIENQALDQAQEYIRSLHEKVDEQTVTRYCENMPVNLVLSTFTGQALEAGIDMSVKIHLSSTTHVSDMDMCVLLSNALENAIHGASLAKGQGKETKVQVYGYEKNNRIFLEVSNSCTDEVVIEDGIPVTREQGHGIGVRSICAIIKKYEGIYTFDVKDNWFVLRLSI